MVGPFPIEWAKIAGLKPEDRHKDIFMQKTGGRRLKNG
jgi:hypothetical protein